MKKNIVIILLLLGLFTTACYDDFRNDYPYTTVAFSTATGGLTAEGELGRTVVMGEGLEMDFGVYVAGLLENDKEWWADFIIDPSLLNGTSYQLMPESYYTLSNDSRITIPAGDYVGKITVSLDSTAFVNDPLSTDFNYALPIRLTDTNADSLHNTQSAKILVLKYINRYEGYYNHTGSYVTYDGSGTEISSGTIDNLLIASTVMLDTIAFNGVINNIGDEYRIKLIAMPDNSVYLEKVPVTAEPITVPYNLAFESALSTDYVSGWESLEAVRDDVDPIDSYTRDGDLFGNWNSAGEWGWLQYDFPGPREVSSTEIYWFSDGGGLQFPDETKIEYLDLETEEWVEVPNPVGLGHDPDVFNVTTFDPVITYAIRYSFMNNSASIGIHEFRVFGIPKTIYPEQAIMESVTDDGSSSWDPENYTFTLNYTVNYKAGSNYTEVTSELVWRNRIRDGVNEWRR